MHWAKLNPKKYHKNTSEGKMPVNSKILFDVRTKNKLVVFLIVILSVSQDSLKIKILELTNEKILFYDLTNSKLRLGHKKTTLDS